MHGPSSHSVYPAKVSTDSHILNTPESVRRRTEREKKAKGGEAGSRVGAEARDSLRRTAPAQRSLKRTVSVSPQSTAWGCGLHALPHGQGQKLSAPAWEASQRNPSCPEGRAQICWEGTFPPSQAEPNPRAQDLDGPLQSMARLTGPTARIRDTF